VEEGRQPARSSLFGSRRGLRAQDPAPRRRFLAACRREPWRDGI